MGKAPTAAFILVSLAGLVGAWFLVQTAICGASVTEEVAEGAEPAPARCVSAPHPVAMAIVAASGLSIYLLVQRRPEAVLIMGILLTLAGTVFIFSAGYWGIAGGVLLTTAGAVGWGAKSREAKGHT